MKKFIIGILLLLLTGCFLLLEKKEKYNSFIITSDNENFTAYCNGKDVSDKRMEMKQQTEKAISKFLNRNQEDLEFSTFCMLENKGMTIEVMVDGISYTFTCNIDGQITGVGRTDGLFLK